MQSFGQSSLPPAALLELAAAVGHSLSEDTTVEAVFGALVQMGARAETFKVEAECDLSNGRLVISSDRSFSGVRTVHLQCQLAVAAKVKPLCCSCQQ